MLGKLQNRVSGGFHAVCEQIHFVLLRRQNIRHAGQNFTIRGLGFVHAFNSVYDAFIVLHQNNVAVLTGNFNTQMQINRVADFIGRTEIQKENAVESRLANSG